jgi:hypothetical protein
MMKLNNFCGKIFSDTEHFVTDVRMTCHFVALLSRNAVLKCIQVVEEHVNKSFEMNGDRAFKTYPS